MPKRKNAENKSAAPDIFAAVQASFKRIPVPIPGLDLKVYARPLTGAEVRGLSDATLKDGADPTRADAYDDERLTQLIVAASIVDGRGQPLIPEGREAEIDDLPNAVSAALRQAALRVNGMGAAAGAEGNSGATPGVASSTG